MSRPTIKDPFFGPQKLARAQALARRKSMPHGNRCPVCWVARGWRWMDMQISLAWDQCSSDLYWIRSRHEWRY